MHGHADDWCIQGIVPNPRGDVIRRCRLQIMRRYWHAALRQTDVRVVGTSPPALETGGRAVSTGVDQAGQTLDDRSGDIQAVSLADVSRGCARTDTAIFQTAKARSPNRRSSRARLKQIVTRTFSVSFATPLRKWTIPYARDVVRGEIMTSKDTLSEIPPDQATVSSGHRYSVQTGSRRLHGPGQHLEMVLTTPQFQTNVRTGARVDPRDGATRYPTIGIGEPHSR